MYLTNTECSPKFRCFLFPFSTKYIYLAPVGDVSGVCLAITSIEWAWWVVDQLVSTQLKGF